VLSLVVLAVAAHLAVQYAVLAHTVSRTTAAHREWDRTAAELHRLGVRPPCLLTGDNALPIAFYTGCRSAATTGPNANATAAGIAEAARRMPAAALVAGHGSPPAYARAWAVHRFGDLRLYVAPSAAPGAASASAESPGTPVTGVAGAVPARGGRDT
jgi:hypothetical protein